MTKTITPPNQTNFYQWTVGNEVGINAGTLGSATVQTNEYSLFMIGANDTLNNSGAILNGLSGHAAIGVKGSGDVITNQGTGTIAGAADGDGVYNAYSSNRVSITNYGLIASGQGPSSAIVLHGGGFVSNASSGTLTGSGVYMGGATGTVVNAGRISGDSTYGGVYLTAGGLITNLGGGTISANGAAYGVRITGGAGTVTNAGTINGGSGFAVELAAGNTNRVIVDQGAVFLGTVSGGSSAGSTLELTSGSSAGTLSGFNGSSITNFGTLAFDMGADWTVSGTSAASGLGSIAITGFTLGDTIDLTGFGFTTVTKGYATNELTLTNSSSAHATLHIEGTFGSGFSLASDDSGGTFITVACYCGGTRILTPSGEIPIEDLAIGDPVLTVSGAARPIKWIGRRSYQGRFIAGNRAVLPIRIASGALADGVPRRDLNISPGHALLIDGVLVAADKLINGISICQLETVDSLEYIHLELDGHDVVLAEGAAAETYVECDNRGKFQNAAEFGQLYPDVEAPKWAYCAPRVEDDESLARVRRILDQRLEACGYAKTTDPALRLLVDGGELQPDFAKGGVYLFRLTKPSTDVRIVSHSSVPSGIVDASNDKRRLGVNLSWLVLRSDHATMMIEHTHPALVEGFHDAEATHRWTDGSGRIPPAFLGCFGRDLTIEVRVLGGDLPYRAGCWSNPAATALVGTGGRGGRQRRGASGAAARP